MSVAYPQVWKPAYSELVPKPGNREGCVQEGHVA